MTRVAESFAACLERKICRKRTTAEERYVRKRRRCCRGSPLRNVRTGQSDSEAAHELIADSAQRLIEIIDEIIQRFYADRQSYQLIVDAKSRTFFFRNAGVRHDGRMIDEALHPAQTLG